MIRHAIDLERFMIIILDHSCQILMEAFFQFRMNQSFSKFHSKNQIYVDLSVGVGHGEKMVDTFLI